jgi:uncharacterized protein YjbI with pentapeptide repeats
MTLAEKYARQRWVDPSFQQECMSVIRALQNGSADLVAMDLAGISLGNGPVQQLWNVNLYRAKLEDVDLSYSNLACSMNEAELQRVRLVGADLDRCLLRKARLFKCNFEGAKLVVSLDDSSCEECNFMRASFLGGKAGAEYGGRRVKFVSCDFTGAVFKGIELRATQFVNCSFERARFIQCDLRGVRVDGGSVPVASQFERMDVPDWATSPQ